MFNFNGNFSQIASEMSNNFLLNFLYAPEHFIIYIILLLFLIWYLRKIQKKANFSFEWMHYLFVTRVNILLPLLLEYTWLLYYIVHFWIKHETIWNTLIIITTIYYFILTIFWILNVLFLEINTIFWFDFQFFKNTYFKWLFIWLIFVFITFFTMQSYI